MREQISKVTEGIYRGPRLNDLSPLMSLGIKTILNLENDNKVVSNERSRAKFLGLKFKWWPMDEIKRPDRDTLIEAMETISFEPYQPIYVHCKHGQDRTGYVIAAYRMLIEGWTFEQAYKECKDMGHHWWFAPYLLLWPKSLKELVK